MQCNTLHNSIRLLIVDDKVSKPSLVQCQLVLHSSPDVGFHRPVDSFEIIRFWALAFTPTALSKMLKDCLFGCVSDQGRTSLLWGIDKESPSRFSLLAVYWWSTWRLSWKKWISGFWEVVQYLISPQVNGAEGFPASSRKQGNLIFWRKQATIELSTYPFYVELVNICCRNSKYASEIVRFSAYVHLFSRFFK